MTNAANDNLKPLPQPWGTWAERSDIDRKPGLQVRESENDQAIQDYKRRYVGAEQRAINEGHDPQTARKIAGAILPPLTVVQTKDGDWLLADGYQRDAAAEQLGWGAVPIEIIEGDYLTALGLAFEKNQIHGVKWTNADKRRAARLALEQEELFKRTDTWLSDFVGVSTALIAEVREEVAGEKGYDTSKRVVQRNGKTYEQRVPQQRFVDPQDDYGDGIPSRQVDEDTDPFEQDDGTTGGYVAPAGLIASLAPAPAKKATAAAATNPMKQSQALQSITRRKVAITVTYAFEDTGESDSLDVSELEGAPTEVRAGLMRALGVID